MSKIIGAVLLQILMESVFLHSAALIAPDLVIQIFFEKSDSMDFEPLLSPNPMHDIIKIVGADTEIILMIRNSESASSRTAPQLEIQIFPERRTTLKRKTIIWFI